jgi:hypothetical protein
MAGRDLSAAFIAEITAGGLAPIALLEAHFDSGNINLWTGVGDLVTGGKTYVGTCGILSISQIQERKKITANGLSVTLNGLDNSILTLVEDEPFHGRTFEMYLAVLTEAGAVVADPYLMFEGFMDFVKIKDDAKTITIDMNIENVLISLERPLDTKYTSEDQKRDYPNDTFFDFIADIQNKEVIWG